MQWHRSLLAHHRRCLLLHRATFNANPWSCAVMVEWVWCYCSRQRTRLPTASEYSGESWLLYTEEQHDFICPRLELTAVSSELLTKGVLDVESDCIDLGTSESLDTDLLCYHVRFGLLRESISEC
eukprot:5265629-Amphidinium_carterae.2